MRLLNAWTFEVQEFHDRETPPYAILSHTWGDGEVLFQDIQTSKAKFLKGYSKIKGCCIQARLDGLEHVWIDTCCIDKTSSTELAEAINSMFTWYRKSVICYAYLDDLDGAAVREDRELLGGSRWFTRGWTLQELIAPGLVTFFGAKWVEIGNRNALVHVISKVTGIDQGLFLHGKLSQFSMAQRMSWAANRQTSRVEDEAYCLLGLFGVTMPLVYGEGTHAFIRLQEEILRRSDDQSIFAWTMSNSTASGLLASSPACFANTGTVSVVNNTTQRSPVFATNGGIQIALPIMKSAEGWNLISNGTEGTKPAIVITPPDSVLAILNCQTQPGTRLGITLERSKHGEQYHRVNVDRDLVSISESDFDRLAKVQTIVIRSHDPLDEISLWDTLRPTFFGIRGLPNPVPGYETVQTFGMIKISKTGMISAMLTNSERAGVIFTNKKTAFGIFLAETWNQSCWELTSGTSANVHEQAQNFKYKHERQLTSQESLRVAVGEPPAASTPSPGILEICMDTTRRYHGYYSVVKMQSRTDHFGSRLAEPDGLLEDEVGIGKKNSTTYSNPLSSLYPPNQPPQLSEIPAVVEGAPSSAKRKRQQTPEKVEEDSYSRKVGDYQRTKHKVRRLFGPRSNKEER